MFEYNKSLSNEDDNGIDVCDYDGDEETINRWILHLL